MNTKEFEGYDWYELATAWNVYVPTDDNWQANPRALEWFLTGVLTNALDKGEYRARVMRKVCADIRAFLLALAEADDYSAPVWRGLAEVEDDWVLLSFVLSKTSILSRMWT